MSHMTTIIGFLCLALLIVIGFTVSIVLLHKTDEPVDQSSLEDDVDALQNDVKDLSNQVSSLQDVVKSDVKDLSNQISALQNVVDQHTTQWTELQSGWQKNEDGSYSLVNIKDIALTGGGMIDSGNGNQIRMKIADDRYISVDNRDMLQIGYFTQGDDDKTYWYFNADGDFGGPIGHGISQDNDGVMTLDQVGSIYFTNRSVIDGTQNDETEMRFLDTGRHFSLNKKARDIFNIGDAKTPDGTIGYWYYNQDNQEGTMWDST